MALKDTWVDKVDGVDDVLAETTNNIANSVIDLENEVGDIGTALDSIIAIQESLIGGDSV